MAATARHNSTSVPETTVVLPQSTAEHQRMMKRSTLAMRGTAVLVLVVAQAVPARAQDICVICSEPSAVYRCQLDGGAKIGPPQQLFCMQQLAQQGAHASCAVRRGVSGSACDGPMRIVTAPPLPAAASGEAALPRTSNTLSRPPTASTGDPPATVAEAARRAKAGTDAQFKKADEQWRASTEKTGGALKRGWDCVASFFKRCGNE